VTNDPIDDFDFVIARKPAPPPLFTCLVCEKPVEKIPPHWHSQRPREREPICKRCTGQWGRRQSGPVFNRQNYHTLSQLSAMTARLEWEIHNGHR
jgi:hypothetical protein